MNELKYIFEKHNVCEADRDNIVHSIFENPSTITEQFMLNKEFRKSEDLYKKLNDILGNKDLVGAVNSLFIVQDDLQLPDGIEKKILNSEKLAVLVGAGVSKLLDFPLWTELGNSAIRHLYDKNIINHFEYQGIMNDVIDPKQKLTIFDSLIPRYTDEGKEFYEQIFEHPKYDNGNPYKLLVRINWVKLTSNMDKEFYKALDEKLQRVPSKTSEGDILEIQERAKIASNFDVKTVDYKTIYHIHGSVDEIAQTVLTARDYIKAYYNDQNGLKTFLTDIFKEYTVIFIGYGLEEFAILEQIMMGDRAHYALVGTYLNEMNLFGLKREYFKSLKIEAIPYYLDFNGYFRLISVLNSWVQKIEGEKGKRYYEKIEEIDKELD